LLVTKRLESLNAVLVTIFAGIFFIGFQAYEYLYYYFFISTGAYGSTFFLTTGFHGFHVFVGLTFIVICFIRQIKYHFTDEHHVGFESASWYWHFVDVVWVGLFLSIY
jgi:heme/copper-type cytochrome/quinol oxidase subunit 3